MEYVTTRGDAVPKVGVGTAKLTGEDCYRTVERALDLGYRHVDTAERYGNEREVGDALAAAPVRREDVFLTTKVWGRHATYEGVHESAHASLDRLGVDQVDLLLLDWPNPRVPLEETMQALAELQQSGLTRHVGVSNFSLPRLRRAQRTGQIPIFADGVTLTPHRPRRRLLDHCRKAGLLLLAYSKLGRSVVRDRLLARIGRRYGKTAAQVSVRWTIQHENVVAVLRAGTPARQREAIDVFDFELTDAEMELIGDRSRLRSALGRVRGRIGW